ncbi:MAG: leucine-rich repeat protein, partial [Lachnospiraceae bacterium]|nr:leucine-rich repeat protein [Lachnospiraceae bacterium]
MLTKRKRIFSRIISIALMASVLLTSNGIVVMAENVQTAEQESSVIEISSAKDLQKIADNLTGDYVLTKNIDMSDVEFTPIGNNTEPFSGTFDGDGHTISNLNISVKNSGESNFTGLFGVLENATVRNLALENCIITSKTTGGIYAGIIAGKMKNSLLEDIYVSGQIDIKEKTAYSVGGIVGAVFQNVDDETQALKHNVARCIGNVLINVPKNANGENGALVGYAEDTALIENSYSYVLDTKLFGVEIGENNSCKILNESTWNKENSYIGFDFKNVWKITDGGARLCEQTYEKSEGIINSSSDVNEDAEPTEIPKVQKTTDQPNTEADSAKQSKVAGEKASKSISGDNMKTPEQSNDVEGDSDDGIMLLASDLTSGDFTYTVSGNNATITGYTGSSGNLKIPETIDGYKVTGIGGQAFYNQEKIYNVEIPETVTYLGSMMIRGTAVSSITIPKSVSDCGVNNSGSNYYLGPLAGASYLTAV